MSHKSEADSLPPFENSSLDHIVKKSAILRDTFQSNKTKNVEYRLVQLRKLYWGLMDYSSRLVDALHIDMRKPSHESYISEVDWAIADCLFTINNLEKWVQDEKLAVPLAFAIMKPRIRKEPLGPVIIIGAYNYPVNVSIGPLIGAIAAGCPAILKPSEHAPATAAVMQHLIGSTLDPTAYGVVNGGVPETTALLEETWAKILFTGGQRVAKIISKKAAETLTPVCLELGGKNPSFVTRHADIKLAARRLLWGKCFNAGQICISPNYMIVDRVVLEEFIKYMQDSHREFYPNGAKTSPDLSRIVNTQQFDRIKNMLDETKGKVVLGGETDRDELYIAPTAILVESPDDIVIQEESFGPIWGIIPYDNLDDAIRMVNSVDPTPLVLNTFGNKQECEKVLGSITSGGASMNDSAIHASILAAPFGGVGTSGTGNYRGRASFDCFTHRRTIAESPTWMPDFLLRVRYPPYQAADLKQMRMMNGAGLKIDFDRDGRRKLGMLHYIWKVFGLGGSSAKGALARWMLVFATAYGLAFGRRGELMRLLSGR